MKFYIRSVFRYFLYIYLMASIGAAAFISIVEPDAVLSVNILWQLLLVCFISAIISSFLLDPAREVSKRQMIVRIVFHFILIYILIFISGLFLGWISIHNIRECVGFLIMFCGIYLGIWIINYIKDHQMAEKLNEKIKSYNEETRK